MGKEKKRANEIMEAESLSDGSPVAAINAETERGTAAEGNVVCEGTFAVEGEDAAFDCISAVPARPAVAAVVFCRYTVLV